MAESLSISEALERLEAAVVAVEAAAGSLPPPQRGRRPDGISEVQDEVQRLSTDRSRLAQSLDAAEARAARLDEVNAEVSRGLVTAMEEIRDILDRQGGLDRQRETA